MMRKQSQGENRGFGLLLIPLAALLALASGVLLYAKTLQPRSPHAEVACRNCHLADTTPGNAAMLTFSQLQLCGECHPDSAHLRHPSGFVRTSGQNWECLDQYSIQCLGCHGDKANTYDDMDVIVVASNQILHHGSLNHSIGRSYAAAMVFGGYRPIEKLSGKIHLPNGVVSCISCHDGDSRNHGKLVTTMTGSALCFECHNL